jgi:hypothetical protein
MHRFALVFVLAVVVLGCSSAEPGPPIEVDIRQVNGSPDLYRYSGQVSLHYIVTIANPLGETYQIERVEVSTPTAGAYALRRHSTLVSKQLNAASGLRVPVHAWGYAPGGRMRSEEPVTIAVAVYGRSSLGPFVKRIHRVITEFDDRDGV